VHTITEDAVAVSEPPSYGSGARAASVGGTSGVGQISVNARVSASFELE
jgi:hypothetical protein